MKTIKNHLESEKASYKPNEMRIRELTKILKAGTLNLEDWRLTGRFTPANEYLIRNSNVKLKNNCLEVIEYVGEVIIEVLKTNDFVFEDTKSKVLDEVEDKAWEKISKNLWD